MRMRECAPQRAGGRVSRCMTVGGDRITGSPCVGGGAASHDGARGVSADVVHRLPGCRVRIWAHMPLADRMRRRRRHVYEDEIANAMNFRTAWRGERTGSAAGLCEPGAGAARQPAFRSGCLALRLGSAAAMAPEGPSCRNNRRLIDDREVPIRGRWTIFGSARLPTARPNLGRACGDAHVPADAERVSRSANDGTKDADKERSSARRLHRFGRPRCRRVAASMVREACAPTHGTARVKGSCPR